MKLKDLQEWLDGEEFNSIACYYRSQPLERPKLIEKAFEELKLHIAYKILELS